MSTTTRILIADDHQILIDGILAILKEMPEVNVIGTVNNGQQLLHKLRTVQADLILLDLNMPQLDGIDTLTILQRDFPAIKVLILSNYQQSELVKEIKQLGARGYLLKSTTTPVLKEAILAVASGKQWYDEASESMEPENPYFFDEFMQKYKLTKREVQIICMIADQKTTKEIGDKLCISEFTVTTHRRNIMRKLNLKNSAGIFSFANEHNLTRKLMA
jgi:two-component system, NarL family, response regulator DegU